MLRKMQSAITPDSILRFIDMYDEEAHVVLIFDNILDDLSQKIVNGAMFEKKARRIIFSLITAVKHIHDQKLLHRNICLESLVIGQGMNWYESVKLTNFDSAVEMTGLRDESVNELIGKTWKYCAPEVLRD